MLMSVLVAIPRTIRLEIVLLYSSLKVERTNLGWMIWHNSMNLEFNFVVSIVATSARPPCLFLPQGVYHFRVSRRAEASLSVQALALDTSSARHDVPTLVAFLL